MTRTSRSDQPRKPRPPLDAAALERLALFYVGRFATTRMRLADYLVRKVRERGWGEEPPPDIEALVGKIVDYGYVDDAAFAVARAGGLQRRGFGARRVAQALRAAGIGDEDRTAAIVAQDEGAWDAALIFARRKRIGPYALEKADRSGRDKAFGAMLRAGHSSAMARRIVSAEPGGVPEQDE